MQGLGQAGMLFLVGSNNAYFAPLTTTIDAAPSITETFILVDVEICKKDAIWLEYIINQKKISYHL